MNVIRRLFIVVLLTCADALIVVQYFDVPANARNSWRKFSDAGPLITVNQATDLPTVVID